MNNLKDKLRNGIEDLISMIDDTKPTKSFPSDAYRIVEIDGKTYQLHISCTLYQK